MDRAMECLARHFHLPETAHITYATWHAYRALVH